MLKMICSVLLMLSSFSALAQTPDSFLIKGEFGEFIQGPRAEAYFQRLAKKAPKNVVPSVTCAHTQVVDGSTMPIGFTDRLYYLTHINFDGHRCVADCNPRRGEEVPAYCMDQTQEDGSHLFQCVLTYHGRQEHPEESGQLSKCVKNAWNQR